MSELRVLVVDDHQVVRRGLRMLLSTLDDIEVVGEAGDGAEAMVMIRHLSPSVVLTDARMPRMDGVELVAAAKAEHPELPVLVLTTFDDDDIVHGALGAGAAGFLLKDTSTDALGDALRAVAAGGLVIDPRVARVALARDAPVEADHPLATLTRAERLVAERLALGETNTEIASELVLAEGTVKNHVSSLLRKLGQRDRTALALLLYRTLSTP